MAQRTKPTALKILQGNPGKKPLPENEPKLQAEAPPAPSTLSPVAKKHWRKIVKQLAACGIMTRIDAQALASYCEVYAQWRMATDLVHEHGLLDVDASGIPKMSAAANAALKYTETMRKMLIEFGMTPAGRAKVQKVDTGKSKADPWLNI